MLCHSSVGAAWKFIVKESLGVRFDPFPFPLTLPHFDNVDKASKVGRVRFRVGQKFSHCLAIHRVRFLWVVVALRAAVKETVAYLRTTRRPEVCLFASHDRRPGGGCCIPFGRIHKLATGWSSVHMAGLVEDGIRSPRDDARTIRWACPASVPTGI